MTRLCTNRLVSYWYENQLQHRQIMGLIPNKSKQKWLVKRMVILNYWFIFSNGIILKWRIQKELKRNGLRLNGFVFAVINLVDWSKLYWQLHRIIFGTRCSHLPFRWNNHIPILMKNLWTYFIKKKIVTQLAC